jgi:hypothetical protein
MTEPGTKTKTFTTGAVRTRDADHVRYDLISPIALAALAKTYAEGAGKYGDFNWEKGMPVHDLLNHALQHICKYLAGDRAEPHLPHAAWGLMAAIHSEAMWPELNRSHLRGPGCVPPLVETGPENTGGR